MRGISLFIAVVAVLVATVFAASHGFNDNVAWHTNLAEAKQLAAAQNKPLMVLIHKSWCGACKRLNQQLSAAGSEPFVEASNSFVMVNLSDDAEPSDAAYAPDGGYIPRVLFLDSAGNVKPELKNPTRSGQYLYFYTDAGSLVAGMKNALTKL